MFYLLRFGSKTEDLDSVSIEKGALKKLQTKDKTRDRISDMGEFKVLACSQRDSQLESPEHQLFHTVESTPASSGQRMRFPLKCVSVGSGGGHSPKMLPKSVVLPRNSTAHFSSSELEPRSPVICELCSLPFSLLLAHGKQSEFVEGMTELLAE